MHELHNELVMTIQAQQLVLVVALVEEHDVHRHTVDLVNGLDLGYDAWLVIAFVLEAEIRHSGLEFFDLRLCGAKSQFQIDRICQGITATLVEDEKGVQDGVWGLYHMSLHLLELGIQERDLEDIIVVAHHHGARVPVYGHSISDVEGVLDKHEYDRLKL